jgi:hypothetical protein
MRNEQALPTGTLLFSFKSERSGTSMNHGEVLRSVAKEVFIELNMPNHYRNVTIKYVHHTKKYLLEGQRKRN